MIREVHVSVPRTGITVQACGDAHIANFGAFSKLTEAVDGRTQIRSDPPLIVPLRDMRGYADNKSVDETERIIRDTLQSYRGSLPRERRILIDRYRVVDIARKVVGVGSVGNRSWIVVMEGISGNDPLVLQVKEAQASVLENYLGILFQGKT